MRERNLSPERQRLRDAFRKPSYVAVRVLPGGFDIADGHYGELRGRIVKTTLARKLFDDGMPVCSSADGVRAEDGTLCETCQHPCCQPRLRVGLSCGGLIYVLDLPPTSAENLFAFEDEVETQGKRVIDCDVRVTVLDRGHWGEVNFEGIESSAG